MSKSTDTSIKLLVLYDILSKMTDEEHALSTNEIIAELNKRGIPVSRKVLPSDIALLNKYGYEILCGATHIRYGGNYNACRCYKGFKTDGTEKEYFDR